MPETADEALRRLEERLQRASGAAERLFSEAAAQATAAAMGRDRAPAQGWEGPGEAPAPGDLELLTTALEAVADLIPPELRRRLGAAVREVLLAVRALIDWYLERSERRSGEPPEVQDIPVV